jgi:hypothetical protein
LRCGGRTMGFMLALAVAGGLFAVLAVLLDRIPEMR